MTLSVDREWGQAGWTGYLQPCGSSPLLYTSPVEATGYFAKVLIENRVLDLDAHQDKIWKAGKTTHKEKMEHKNPKVIRPRGKEERQWP